MQNYLVSFWISRWLFMPIIAAGLILMLCNSRSTQQGSCSSLCDSHHAGKGTGLVSSFCMIPYY